MENNFVCPVCKGKVATVEDVVNKQQVIVVERINNVAKEMKSKCNATQAKMDKVYDMVKKLMGTRKKELNRVLEQKLGVAKQAHHSQCFVGNHCTIVLEIYEKLTAKCNYGLT